MPNGVPDGGYARFLRNFHDLEGIEHVAVGGRPRGIEAWTRLGFTCTMLKPSTTRRSRWRMTVGPFCVELMVPTSPDSPVAKFRREARPGASPRASRNRMRSTSTSRR
jgi:hypothetical protein